MLRFVVLAALVSLCVCVPTGQKIPAEVADVFSHLEELQAIANKHGSRAVETGYDDSAEYVISQLKKTDYIVEKQFFVVPIYSELAQPLLSLPQSNPKITLNRCAQRTGWQRYESSCDYAGIRYGGNGTYDITETLHFVGNGCKAENFAGFPAGKIALASAGGCEYVDKGYHAEDAGAVAVVLFNDLGVAGSPGGRVYNSATWVEGDRVVQIPFIGVTNTIGTLLQQHKETVVHIETSTVVNIARTFNVIAESRGGNENRVVMIGSHLDGVPEGPGINDNGSGSATVLAIALRLNGKSFENKIRFGFWGAEEVGLVGSRYYVRDLVQRKEHTKLVGYLNFDMEASPNYIRLIYNGTEGGAARSGSESLMRMFEEHFNRIHLSWALTSMAGGSDFLPFILAGIPSSGMAAGASGLKSIGERYIHGGLANTQLDPCYHAPCDSIDNVSPSCILETSNAAIEVLSRMANDNSFLANSLLEPNEILESLRSHRDTTTCISDEERPGPSF